MKVPVIPMSYPKIRPLEAATMQVMTTESVILPSKPLGEEAWPENAPTAIFWWPCFFLLRLFYCFYAAR